MDKKSPTKSKVRRPKPEFTHQLLAGTVVTLLIGAAVYALEPWLSNTRIALALVTAALGVGLFWAFLSGCRLRSPFYRLPLPELPKTRTKAEEQRREATRNIKGDMTRVFHVRVRPARDKLREIVNGLIVELKAGQEAWFLLGSLMNMFPNEGLTTSEHKLRRSLEGVMWEDAEKGEFKGGAFIRELDLDKQTPDGLAWDFWSYYADYRLLVNLARSISKLLPTNEQRQVRLVEFQTLDERLTESLRELLANPELATFREGFQEMYPTW